MGCIDAPYPHIICRYPLETYRCTWEHGGIPAQVSLAKYPPETASILHRDTFCFFFLKDEYFVSKTIHDSNIDPEKFPGSKVNQLAKKGAFKVNHLTYQSNCKWPPSGSSKSHEELTTHQASPNGNNIPTSKDQREIKSLLF